MNGRMKRLPWNPSPVLFGLALLVFLSTPGWGADLKDSESASHGDTAALVEVVNTYQGSGYQVLQFNLAVLSHYSYLLISGKEALVVDPDRDIDAYLETARKQGVEIKGVLLSHSHADFVAGHMEMAKAVGCPIHFNEKAAPLFPHLPIKEGSVITVGDAQVRILETPGHTPDGLCGVVSARSTPESPEMLFSGDTLFVGSVGRPDLMGGTTSAAELAGMMFDSWNQKLSKLPDALKVLPAHGAGSLCGAHLSDAPSSSIGRERTSNAYLKLADNRSAFIAGVLDGLPDAPPYFQHNAKMNHAGPELVNWKEPLPEPASPSQDLTDMNRWFVVDLREAKEFAAGHIPHSVNIAVRGRLETWVGIMVPWGSPLLLCGSVDEMTEAVHRLHRVGYRAGIIPWESWKIAGLPQLKNAMIKPAELHAMMQKKTAPMIVDVRLPSEWMGLRIGPVLNLPLDQLGTLAPMKLNRQEPVVAVCNSAYRSSMAIGILERVGFQQATSLDGGSEAWIEAGLPVISAAKEPGSTPEGGDSTRLRHVNLPDRLSPAELKRLAVDLPGSFELIDLRPRSADYNPLQAKVVDVVEAMTNPVFLVGEIPLIIADRDGSIALMVAGVLSQKTKRPIKALHGGMEAYWAESELQKPGSLAGSQPVKPASGGMIPEGVGISPPPLVPAATGGPVPTVPSEPVKPKKKSGGC